jgi:MFS family permease
LTIIRAVARAIPGAVFGALFGVLLLGVGAIRLVVAVVVALVKRQPLDFDAPGLYQFLVFVLVYCTSFSIAGAMLSALWPLRESRLGAYLLGYLGAGIVSAILGGLMMWMDHDYDLRKHAFVWCVMTLTFGTAAGYGIHHWETPQETLNRLQRRRPDLP